jgi:uncharacterized membrane protein YagU involved in acid resistance
MLAGAVAGLIGSFAMTRFHVALSGRGLTDAEEPQSNKPVDGRDDAAMKTADLVAQSTAGRPLSPTAKKEVGGPAAHYAFGLAAGALFGALRELMPCSSIARGGPYGAAVWVAADQLALPLAGLSPWPLKAYPPSVNLQHLTAHLVYGWATAATYSSFRRAL